MNLDKLTDSEVATLIQSIKVFLNHPILITPTIGKFKTEDSVSDKINGISYKLSIFRGNLDTKYSMHIRFGTNNYHLVRLCINGSRHHNSDGSVLPKSHIHIYRFRNGTIEAYARQLDTTPFDKSDELAKSMEKFIKYVNIKTDLFDTNT